MRVERQQAESRRHARLPRGFSKYVDRKWLRLMDPSMMPLLVALVEEQIRQATTASAHRR